MSGAASDGPVLIVGGSGQIGGCLARLLRDRGRPGVPTYLRHPIAGGVELDAGNPAQVVNVIARTRPSLIINSVNAKGGTDACELDPALARRSHFESAKSLIDAARQSGAGFVQISTDYVFDGRDGPYAEDAVPKPLSQLGRAKLEAERYALAQVRGALVARTSFVFSWTPDSATKNFAMQILEADAAGQELRVPTDQVGNVTYAPNFAEALIELIDGGASGVYHVAGVTRCSKHEWAARMAQWFELSRVRLRGVTTAELGQAGPRPLSSGFSLEKAQAKLSRTRLYSLDDGLQAMQSAMSEASRA